MTETIPQEPKILFDFNKEKAIEAILYLLNQYHRLRKKRLYALLYMSDEYSLKTYGRFISGNTYKAYAQGPVPTDIDGYFYSVKHNRHDYDNWGIKIDDDNYFMHRRNADLDKLSQSDVDSMEYVMNSITSSHEYTWDGIRDMAWMKAYSNGFYDGDNTIYVEYIALLTMKGPEIIDFLVNNPD